MDAQSEINRAIKAAEQSDLNTARLILRNLIKLEPANPKAWLALADVVDNPEHAMQCLERVLRLDPDNKSAIGKLLQLQEQANATNTVDRTVQMETGSIEDRLRLVTQGSTTGSQKQMAVAFKDAGLTGNTASSPKQRAQSVDRRPSRKGTSPTPKGSGRWLEGFLLFVLALSVICVLVLFIFLQKDNSLFGSSSAAQPTPTKEDLAAVIYQNIQASNAEDFDRYMDTIHTKSLSYKTTSDMLKKAFAEYDLSYKVSQVEVVEQNKNEATLSFVLTTRKLRGPSFRNNRVTGEMILRKENGAWKIYDQKIINVEYLD